MELHLESALIERCILGEAGAFQSLAERYYRPVGAFLLRRVNQSDVVEDLCQETFLEAFQALREGRRPARFSTWLFGIAHNRACKWLRRRRPALFDPGAPPEVPVVLPETDLLEELEEQRKQLAALDAALVGLPAETRRALVMKHEQGLTCEQIASELGRPVGTIKSLLSRTYRALRERLGPGVTP